LFWDNALKKNYAVLVASRLKLKFGFTFHVQCYLNAIVSVIVCLFVEESSTHWSLLDDEDATTK